MSEPDQDGMVELRIDVDPEVKVAIEAHAAQLGVSLDRFLSMMMAIYFAEQDKGGVWIQISDDALEAMRELIEAEEDEEETEG